MSKIKEIILQLTLEISAVACHLDSTGSVQWRVNWIYLAQCSGVSTGFIWLSAVACQLDSSGSVQWRFNWIHLAQYRDIQMAPLYQPERRLPSVILK
jgi:hypothetical protein